MTVIAVDGPAASGKGTLARRLAAHYDLRHLDTGLVYRAVGLKILSEGLDPVPAAKAVTLADLDRPELRSEEVGQAASKAAAIPEVRTALRALQRCFAETPPGAVLDGRDIGTVICPDAEVKLYVIAAVEERARRRVKELQGRGQTAIYTAVLEDLKQRDARDSQRAVAPLKPADDAFLLDTSALDADQALAAALSIINDTLSRAT
jgi:cytidylate kinase